jgi:hypothetical protein
MTVRGKSAQVLREINSFSEKHEICKFGFEMKKYCSAVS